MSNVLCGGTSRGMGLIDCKPGGMSGDNMEDSLKFSKTSILLGHIFYLSISILSLKPDIMKMMLEHMAFQAGHT